MRERYYNNHKAKDAENFDDDDATLNEFAVHEHEHDPETCNECQEKAAEESKMKIAMAGFVFFFAILFLMWYMLRSC